MFSSIVALLQFTTILPLGKTAAFEAFAYRTWLYPAAGYVTGGCGAIFLALSPAPPLVSAVTALGVVLLIGGCNHLDGLFDLGDGLMAHGSKEKRIHALCDRTLGTGGIALGLFVTLLSVSALSTIPQAALALLFAEVGGKWTMSLLTTVGRPFHDGLHATLHARARPCFPVISAIFLIPVILLPIPEAMRISALVIMVITPAVLLAVAYRLFGGVNGDLVGASGEITRAAMLTFMVCAI